MKVNESSIPALSIIVLISVAEIYLSVKNSILSLFRRSK
jgi:hypothetical protein